MNLLKDNVKSLFLRYLFAAFGSSIITCIYGIVDMAMVGQYEGPNGTASLAVVAPIWNIIYSLGLLTGVGGAIVFSTLRGKGEIKDNLDNQYFTVSIIGSIIIAIICWILIIIFKNPILTFFGADETLLELANEYVKPILFVLPLFLFNQMLAAYLRNDNDQNLAMIGVLSGGIFNVFGDYFFVFTLNMGIFGAGLATAIGSCVTFIVLLIHFFKKKNTLKLVKPTKLFSKLGEIFVNGFSSFFVDFAMGILTVLFNRQIMKYLGSDALAIYGPIINISTFVQCCAYSVGQASQPIISINYGANQNDRIKKVLKYSMITCIIFGVFWTSLSMIYPNLYIYIFMSPTENILKIAPNIIRMYSISFLLLPINIFSTYYFQAILKPKTAFIVSIMRGLVISGLLSLLLPLINANALWFTMPITELIIFVYVVISIINYTKKLDAVNS